VRKWLFAIVLMVVGLVSLSGSGDSPASRTLASQTSQNTGPQYDSKGALLRPKHFETWVFVGASTGLSYQRQLFSRGPGEFHNVYITPEAYQAYLQTGRFPEKTMLALALYQPSEKVSPSKAGYFEGNFDALEVAVKDHEHFSEGWAYFSFEGEAELKERVQAFSKSDCFSCHVQHAADDNVFTQFYPILRPITASHKKASGDAGR
jgi:hypothetical protein